MTAAETERAISLMEGVNGLHTPPMKYEEPTVTAGRMFNPGAMKQVFDLAQAFSSSSLVQDQFRGKKGSVGHANCVLALSMALELDISWIAALTQMYVVKGKVGFPAQLLIALANRRAPIKGPIRYKEEGSGDDLTVTAYAIDKHTDEKVEYSLSLKEAKDAGASGSGWNNQPKLRLRYRAATYLIRTVYPEVLMGIYETDEISETGKNDEQNETVSEINEQLAIVNDSE